MDRTQRERTLGRTLRLGEVEPGARLGMDLVLEPGPGGRDLAWQAGTDALAQDLTVALLTPLREDLLHQQFGFEGLAALSRGGGVRLTQELLRLATMRLVAADARIRSVERVEVSRTDPAGRAWRVDVAARTVTDDRVDVTWRQEGSDG